jgi:hypothetical protein
MQDEWSGVRFLTQSEGGWVIDRSTFFVAPAAPALWPVTSQAHGYDFVQADSFGGTVDLVARDRAGNETTQSFSVVNC